MSLDSSSIEKDGLLVPFRFFEEQCLLVLAVCRFPAMTKGLESLRKRRVVNRVRMVEGSRPQLPTPVFGEILGSGLAGEPTVSCLRLLGDDLHVAEFVEEDVVKHESTHGEPGPLDIRGPPRIESATGFSARIG